MKMRIGRLVAAGAVVVSVVSAEVALGATPGTRLSCLDWSARTKTASTSSGAWANVPGMAITSTLAENFAVEVSGTFTGAAAQLRLRDTFVGGTFSLKPGVTSIDPSGSSQAFSFTWVGTNPAEHQHTFHLQWRRSAASGTAELTAGALTLLYQGAPTPATC